MPPIVSRSCRPTTARTHRRAATLSAMALLGFCVSGGIPLSRVAAQDTDDSQSDFALVPRIEWDTKLEKFQFDADKFLGQRMTVRCPPATVGQDYERVFGTDTYPSDSPICVAALHAGKIDTNGGLVTIQLNPGASGYEGSQRNGVTSEDRPATKRSMTFVDGPDSEETDKIHLERIPTISWDSRFTQTGLAHRQLIGQQFTFRCPPAPANARPRLVYGTDTYAFASNLCWAAVHAGKLTKEGGIITVQMGEGVDGLVGSIRNGVETRGKAKGGDRTLTFVDNPVGS